MPVFLPIFRSLNIHSLLLFQHICLGYLFIIIAQSKMSYHMTSSIIVTDYKETLNLSKLQEACKAYSIEIDAFSEIQLESAYAMQGFKAALPKMNKFCFIFISLLLEHGFQVSGFLNGAELLKKPAKDEKQIAELVKQALSSINGQAVSIQDEYKNVEKMFVDLNKKSEVVMKKSNNQMIAIQQIKSSPEYMKICSKTKELCLEIDADCKTIKARRAKAETKNAALVDDMMSVQEEKELIQEAKYKYQSAKNQLSHGGEYLEKFIVQKKAEQEKIKFYDEQSFLRFLECTKSLKKLEYQRKFLVN